MDLRELLLVQQLGAFLVISDPLYLVLFVIFTLMSIFGVFFSTILLMGTIKMYKLYKFRNFPSNVDTSFGHSVPIMLINGIIMFGFCIWYLFFDRGGNLFNCWNSVMVLLGLV